MKSKPCDIQRRRDAECRISRSQDDCVVGQGDLVIQDHLLPNHGRLPDTFQRLVLGLSKIIQGLFNRPSRSSQSLLSFGIVRVACRVDLITAGAEIISGEELGCIHQQTSREIYGVRRGKAELSGGRLVSIRCPRRGFGAGDVLREGLGND